METSPKRKATFLSQILFMIMMIDQDVRPWRPQAIWLVAQHICFEVSWNRWETGGVDSTTLYYCCTVEKRWWTRVRLYSMNRNTHMSIAIGGLKTHTVLHESQYSYEYCDPWSSRICTLRSTYEYSYEYCDSLTKDAHCTPWKRILIWVLRSIDW